MKARSAIAASKTRAIDAKIAVLTLKGREKTPLVLEGTKLLPSLQDVVWETEGHNNNGIFPKFDFRRAKINVEIIKKNSDINAKFEVFERLNTGGSFLSYQEVRNSLLVMSNKEVYLWLSDLANNEDFQNCISLTDRLLLERYDMELALRRAGITILYAHWEGFVKYAAENYLNYVSLKKLRHDQLESCFVALCIKKKINEMDNTNKAENLDIYHLVIDRLCSQFQRFFPSRNFSFNSR